MRRERCSSCSGPHGKEETMALQPKPNEKTRPSQPTCPAHPQCPARRLAFPTPCTRTVSPPAAWPSLLLLPALCHPPLPIGKDPAGPTKPPASSARRPASRPSSPSPAAPSAPASPAGQGPPAARPGAVDQRAREADCATGQVAPPLPAVRPGRAPGAPRQPEAQSPTRQSPRRAPSRVPEVGVSRSPSRFPMRSALSLGA